MRVENVTFNDEAVRKMKKREFIDMHKNVFYLDRMLEDRERMLADIYDKIKGSKIIDSDF